MIRHPPPFIVSVQRRKDITDADKSRIWWERCDYAIFQRTGNIIASDAAPEDWPGDPGEEPDADIDTETATDTDTGTDDNDVDAKTAWGGRRGNLGDGGSFTDTPGADSTAPYPRVR